MGTMKDIISENHIIKFFDNEIYAKNLLFNGEMLFNTLEHFAKYGQAGRGDPSEIVFKISGTICYQDPQDGLYCKLIDFNNINRDKKRLIYCYYDLRKINFNQNNKMYFNLDELKHFSSDNNSLYGVILDRNKFENRVIEYLRKYNIGYTIANINYTDEEVDPFLVLQAQQRQSDLAYFQKSQKYEGQQERRIILEAHLDELLKVKAAEKFNDGCKIYIGDISSFGHLCKLVNFPI